MTEITPFTSPVSGNILRSIDIDGEPWFVAADVCAELDLTNVSHALSRLDDDEKSSIILNDGTPGNPTKTLVNESGLYSLIMTSRKPDAKRVKKWVTSEVLPSIRKTGGYSVATDTTSAVKLMRVMLDQIEASGIWQDKTDKRVGALEDTVTDLGAQSDWYIAMGYAALHGHPRERSYLSRVGKRATALLREAGGEPRKRNDATFGRVNTYPAHVLEQAFKDVPTN